ncbi:hypothetical protein KOSB73_270273 [Klebsiella grimontii]|uniref:Uncharacterized protein n=1 Tax=Klebsiella grimontii TaxID=2058152 RepID=A0A285B6G2_9ENTR|nr:hypothetical protein KOSB73_270273 [Klebsiella grimontii]
MQICNLTHTSFLIALFILVYGEQSKPIGSVQSRPNFTQLRRKNT